MANPFPGMNPYLEDPAFWPDFHGEMTYAMRHQLLEHLPQAYDATVGKRVHLVSSAPQQSEQEVSRRDILPDVGIQWQSGDGGHVGNGAVATLEPTTIEAPSVIEEEVVERWIEVRRGEERELVTVIELLSPGNKIGDGVGAYRQKRYDLLRRGINLLEIDLLTRGQRVEPEERLPRDDYFAVVSRSNRPRQREVYHWPVRDLLPTIPVPLKPKDGDIGLNLATASDEAFARGRYSRRLPYGETPPAELNEQEAGWAVSQAGVAGQ